MSGLTKLPPFFSLIVSLISLLLFDMCSLCVSPCKCVGRSHTLYRAIDWNFSIVYHSDLSVKRKIEKQREKVIRWDSVLQKNAFVQPIPSSTVKKAKRKHKEVQKTNSAQDCPKVRNSVEISFQVMWKLTSSMI